MEMIKCPKCGKMHPTIIPCPVCGVLKESPKKEAPKEEAKGTEASDKK